MPNPVDIHVGKRLRLRRNLLGMSQESLGKAIGVTFQQIQKYETGKNRIGSGRLYDVAMMLAVPIAFFFEGFSALSKGKGKQVPGFAEEALSFEYEDLLNNKETMELVRHFALIESGEMRKSILSMTKSAANRNVPKARTQKRSHKKAS